MLRGVAHWCLVNHGPTRFEMLTIQMRKAHWNLWDIVELKMKRTTWKLCRITSSSHAFNLNPFKIPRQVKLSIALKEIPKYSWPVDLEWFQYAFLKRQNIFALGMALPKLLENEDQIPATQTTMLPQRLPHKFPKVIKNWFRQVLVAFSVQFSSFVEAHWRDFGDDW